MRGGPARMSRGGPPVRPMNEATARTYSLPAPYAGWNARGNIAAMKQTEAIQMDNIFPGIQTVSIRKGYVDWATACPETISSLMPYNGLTTSKLFAATAAGIYDVTSAGAIGAAAVACTGAFYESVNIATAGGNFLFAVNGVDLAKSYNGAAWAVPVITVANSANWNYVTLHKKRIWAVEKETMKLWYLPTESIAGAATVYPVGALFKKGGYVVAIGSWTLDSGSGSDDMFVIATSNGEIAVYQGTDPASSATWALVGVFDVPRPVGTKCFLDYGGDLLYLSMSGIIPMSKLVQSVVVDRSSELSYNIDGAFLLATETYSSVIGWQMVLHKRAGFLLVNVPATQNTVSYQFVMNTVTKAWCRFTGWNASCWADFNGDIYFASDKTVCLAWNSTSDAGNPITGTVYQAYSPLGYGGQKEVSLCRPNFNLSAAAQFAMALDADFQTFGGQTVFTYNPGSAGGIWDTSLWDSGIWDALGSSYESKWTTIPGNLGYLHSLRLQITTSSGNFDWTSTNYAFRPAGIL